MNFKTILLCLLLALPLAAHSNSVRYENLVKRAAQWNTTKVVRTAEALKSKGRKEEALVLYMVAAGRPLDNPDNRDFLRATEAFLGAGDVYYESGNYSQAMGCYLKGLKISERSDTRPLQAVFYKNLGNVFCMFQDYEKGLALYRRGLDCAQDLKDSNTAYKLLLNLTGVCIELSMAQEARRYYEQAQATPHVASEVSRFMDEFTLALVHRAEGAQEEAIRRFKQLARAADCPEIGPRYVCSCFEEIYEIYLDSHQTDSALVYLNRCRLLAEESGLIHEFSESLGHLATLYEGRGDKAQALQFRTRYWQVKDSVFNRRRFDAAKNQQFLYEMEKTELAIARLSEEQEKRARVIGQQQWVIVSSLAGVLAVLLGLLYVYRQNRRLAESYRSLYSLHQRLAQNHRMAKEQERLLGEENAKLAQELATRTSAGTKADETPSEAAHEAAKYSSSNLSDWQRTELSRKIAKVMDNPAHYTSPDFSLDVLAGLVGSNSKYVSQVINEVYGKNFSNYVNEHRVDLACTRLADTEGFGHFTIKGIGESVGFGSHSTFINVFKKITGITPSLYQKLTREEAAKRVRNT